MFQLIHVGFASHPRTGGKKKKKRKDIYEQGFSKERVGRKGWRGDAISVAVIIQWPNP